MKKFILLLPIVFFYFSPLTYADSCTDESNAYMAAQSKYLDFEINFSASKVEAEVRKSYPWVNEWAIQNLFSQKLQPLAEEERQLNLAIEKTKLALQSCKIQDLNNKLAEDESRLHSSEIKLQVTCQNINAHTINNNTGCDCNLWTYYDQKYQMCLPVPIPLVKENSAYSWSQKNEEQLKIEIREKNKQKLRDIRAKIKKKSSK